MSLSADQWAGSTGGPADRTAGPAGPAAGTGRWHPLDEVVWSSLTGAHAALAEGGPDALRYQPDVAPFGAVSPGAVPPDRGAVWPDHGAVSPGDGAVLPDRGVVSPDRGAVPPGDGAVSPGGGAVSSGGGDGWSGGGDSWSGGGDGWPVLAALAGADPVLLAAPSRPPPASWEVLGRIPGVQMVATEAMVTGPEPAAVPLGLADVDEMLDLVARTKPGPFLPRTVLLGNYLGIRQDGALVAMAGERLRPPGFAEISAVCTDPAYRGQGLAGRLIRAVAHGIRARGEIPFLHTAADNHGAIRLYEALGFRLRRPVEFSLVRPPAPPAPTSSVPAVRADSVPAVPTGSVAAAPAGAVPAEPGGPAGPAGPAGAQP